MRDRDGQINWLVDVETSEGGKAAAGTAILADICMERMNVKGKPKLLFAFYRPQSNLKLAEKRLLALEDRVKRLEMEPPLSEVPAPRGISESCQPLDQKSRKDKPQHCFVMSTHWVRWIWMIKARHLSESAKYLRVHRNFLGVMGLAMLTYFAFDLTDALTGFVSAIPPVTYLRLLVIPLSFYLVTGVYCLTLSCHKVSPPDR